MMQVGIFFDKDRVSAALTKDRHRKPLKTASLDLEPDIWDAHANAFHGVFRTLARRLGRLSQRADVGVTISLPDPLIAEDMFEFMDVPNNDSELADLIQLRATRAFGGDASHYRCTWQAMDCGAAGSARYLVRVLPADLFGEILKSAEAAGFRTVSLEGYSRFVQPDQVPGEGIAGHLFAQENWWMLAMWDRTDGMSRVWSDWRNDREAVDDDDLPDRLTRLIKAFSLAQSRAVDGLFVVADTDLSRLVGARTNLPISLGEAPDPVALAAGVSGN